MDGIQAAVLSVKLEHLDNWIRFRQHNAAFYNERLKGTGMRPRYDRLDSRYTYHQYPFLVSRRDDLLKKLLEHGVRAGIHYPFSLPNLKPYMQYPAATHNFADIVATKEISLPVHEMLSDKDLQKVVDIVKWHYEQPSET
jgi:dTDP-4-amino-4,6-dideoxygalactose transaminase